MLDGAEGNLTMTSWKIRRYLRESDEARTNENLESWRSVDKREKEATIRKTHIKNPSTLEFIIGIFRSRFFIWQIFSRNTNGIRCIRIDGHEKKSLMNYNRNENKWECIFKF